MTTEQITQTAMDLKKKMPIKGLVQVVYKPIRYFELTDTEKMIVIALELTSTPMHLAELLKVLEKTFNKKPIVDEISKALKTLYMMKRIEIRKGNAKENYYNTPQRTKGGFRLIYRLNLTQIK